MDIDLGLDELIEQIVADAKNIAIKALEEVGKKTQRDIEDYARNYMEEYYGEYRPTSYRRTRELINAICPYNKKISGVSGNITVGIVYDPYRLSYGKKRYFKDLRDDKDPDPLPEKEGKKGEKPQPLESWILNNFLEGIHPAYTKYSNVIYSGQNQIELMEQALDKVAAKAANDLADAFMSGIAKRMIKK